MTVFPKLSFIPNVQSYRRIRVVVNLVFFIGRENKRVCFVLLSTFRNSAIKDGELTLSRQKKMSFFVLLSIFRNSAIKDGELTPSRQKKEMSFFVLLSIFRNFAAPKST